jgi:hypothetical protein
MQKNSATMQKFVGPAQIISPRSQKNAALMHIFSAWEQISTDGKHIITGGEQITSG